MGHSGVTLNQGMFSVSAEFYNAVQFFIFILLAIMFLLLVILMIINLNAGNRVRKKARLTQNIKKAVKAVMVSSSPEQTLEILGSKKFMFSRRGLAALSEVLGTMDHKSQKRLRLILQSISFDKHLSRLLSSDNEDYLAEIIHLVGELNLSELDADVVNAMILHKDNVNVQYEAFLTLSRLGSYDNIVNICMNKKYEQKLTFRSLIEVISSYSGDKQKLCKALLTAPDAYIVRTSVKLIGTEKITALAPEVEGFLDSENMNLVLDTIRTLSLLRYKAITGKIIKLLKHEAWEVRGVAVSALSAISADEYIDQFITALCDREWQVRYNAGYALSKIRSSDSIAEKVMATNDKFAMDMLEYFTQIGSMRRAAK